MVIRFAPIAVLAAALPIFLAATPTAHAQLTLTLTPNGLVGTAPGTFAFTGVLLNSTSSTIFLNAESPSFNGPATAEDTSPFDSNAPTFLTAGSSYTGGFLNVTLAPTAANGTYFGTLQILGGADGSALSVEASKDFRITVGQASPVPESSTTISLGLLLALGLGGIVVTRRKAAQIA